MSISENPIAQIVLLASVSSFLDVLKDAKEREHIKNRLHEQSKVANILYKETSEQKHLDGFTSFQDILNLIEDYEKRKNLT